MCMHTYIFIDIYIYNAYIHTYIFIYIYVLHSVGGGAMTYVFVYKRIHISSAQARPSHRDFAKIAWGCFSTTNIVI